MEGWVTMEGLVIKDGLWRAIKENSAYRFSEQFMFSLLGPKVAVVRSGVQYTPKGRAEVSLA